MSKKRANKTIEKLGSALELPPGIMGRAAHIELTSNKEAVIDGNCSVLQYEENLVRINTGDSIIKFSGRGLEIKSLTSAGVIVSGYFTSLEFST